MEKNDTVPGARPTKEERHAARHAGAMDVAVVTQTTPDDAIARGERIVPAAAGEEPSREQLEQDVMTTNPSVESMESRG
ncbi:MAG: hypothetical protein K2N93_05955 [Alistipes sp.]|nr:hypothetical protein [Alistipes sp.]